MARGEHPEIPTLARMIAYPTVSDRPMVELAAYVAQRAEDQGFRVTLYEDDVEAGKANVVCEAGPEGVPGGITLSGHLDVVPVEGQSWASDPFVLTEREGKTFWPGHGGHEGLHRRDDRGPGAGADRLLEAPVGLGVDL
jgi:acetylornithine deacetylase